MNLAVNYDQYVLSEVVFVVGLEKLNLPFTSDEVQLFLEDGSKILEDDDLSDNDLVGGKLLILARSFENYKKQNTGEYFIALHCIALSNNLVEVWYILTWLKLTEVMRICDVVQTEQEIII